jgi:nucleoside-diphosphate kinase
MSSQRYSFICDYLDYIASLIRKYQLFFYPEDNSIEMFDIKNKKIFLKRLVFPSITLKDLYIGSEISIYSRKLKIVEYCDDFTKQIFEEVNKSTYGMIKPDSYINIGKIMDYTVNAGMRISKLKMVKMRKEDAYDFYAEHKGKPFYEDLTDFMSSDYCVGMELVGKDAIPQWRSIIGPTNSNKAREEKPNSIRALFGTDGSKNAVHGSDSNNSASRELNFMFGKGTRVKQIPKLSNCSCLIIKPHIIQDGNAGKIIDIILSQGFEISCMEMFYLDKTTSEEFFEVYKGVLPEYSAIIDHVSSGPIIAMEIRQDNVVESLRGLVGPNDPEIAKILRPNTIRAMFGKDRVKNAVHCTDLPTDGVLEVQYFFELLQGTNIN